ncbi:MAG TPA: hypothetical protein VGH10_12650 [Actinomycetota bacterium]
MRRLLLFASAFALAATLLIPSPSAARGRYQVTRLHVHDAAATLRGRPNAAGEQVMTTGYVARPGATSAKSGSGRRGAALSAEPDAGQSGATTTTPATVLQWEGAHDTSVTPSQTAGAIGPTRYVQLVNSQYSIYDRSGVLRPSGSGSLATLTGVSSGDVSEPQVIWDPGTDRFYFVALDCSDACGGSDPSNYLVMGYSKTDSPDDATDWCAYKLDYGYGTAVPDFPRLGDTADFLLFGVNVSNGSATFLHADVDWITKPAAGTSCQSSGAFGTGVKGSLTDGNGTDAFTPVPAVQTDPSSTGYVVSAPFDVSENRGDELSVFTVTKVGSSPSFSAASNVAVPFFDIPQNAPQKGSSLELDTMDARLTNAVSGPDPSHGGALGLWTQHTVNGEAGHAGAAVDWYELSPAGTASLLQSGSVIGTSTYTFNGAISNDRAVPYGGSGAFGDAMALTFDTASPDLYPAVRMVAKVGSEAQSSWNTIHSSTGPNEDDTCTTFCPWGGAGASPDPAAPHTGAHGDVWLTSQWNVDSANGSDVDWRTWNFEVSPQPPTASMTDPSDLFQVSTSFTVAWSGDGATVFNVRYRQGSLGAKLGSYVTWKSNTASTSGSFTGTAGHTYCFDVQAVSGSFLSSWSPDMCTGVPLDDRGLSASGKWGRYTESGWYLSTYTRSKTKNQTLTVNDVRTKRIDLLVQTCPGCASVGVYWGGKLIKTVSLSGSSTQKLQLIFVATFSKVETHQLQLKVTTGGKQAYIDGVAFNKS